MSDGEQAGRELQDAPLHLGLGARAVPQSAITGMEWYADYAARHADDGAEGRLVSFYRFTQSWDSWEMHPAGDEVVLCLEGEMLLHQEFPDGGTARVRIGAGEYAINPPGAWHTADIVGEAAALFITAGLGTQHRPR
ncbi:MAG: cupin domain-containing protein [Sphingomonadales bacterium]|nr:cupin domain-containing protein [Sphingomonadales bacterium]MBD3773106.1 cupin domain-containing protein [Paracoccaceae bacterium]